MSVTAEDLAPWRGHHLAETRWVLEAYRLMADPVWYGYGVPRGDGRGVVLAPGFGAGDQTLVTLGSWLLRMHYRPGLCGFIANVDCSERGLEVVETRVERMAERTGRRVALIGHSRGGHYVRAVAARRPDLVSHAISMGSDLKDLFGISTPTLAAVRLARLGLQRTGRARRPECLSVECDCAFGQAMWAPFPEDRVRLTSVFSRGDGVVKGGGQILPYARNIEITGSHVGLVFNRKAYRVIGQALAEPELVPEVVEEPVAATAANGPDSAAQ